HHEGVATLRAPHLETGGRHAPFVHLIRRLARLALDLEHSRAPTPTLPVRPSQRGLLAPPQLRMEVIRRGSTGARKRGVDYIWGTSGANPGYHGPGDRRDPLLRFAARGASRRHRHGLRPRWRHPRSILRGARDATRPVERVRLFQ